MGYGLLALNKYNWDITLEGRIWRSLLTNGVERTGRQVCGHCDGFV